MEYFAGISITYRSRVLFLAVRLGGALQQFAGKGVAGALLLAQRAEADDLVEGGEVQHAVGQRAAVAGGKEIQEETAQRLGCHVAGGDRERDRRVADLLQPRGRKDRGLAAFDIVSE